MTEQRKQYPAANRMAAASQYMGILSIIFILFVFVPVFATALPLGLVLSNMGILFAHLSKGGDTHFQPQAMVGLGTSIFSLCVYLLLIVLSIAGIWLLIQMFGLETVLDPEALMDALMNLMNQSFDPVIFSTGGSAL